MKNRILLNWNFFRIFRMILGISVVAQGIDAGQWMYIVFGGIFSIMTIFDYGCSSSGSCSIPAENKALIPEKLTKEEKLL